MSVRRIGVVTGTRAEFGLLTPVMHAIDAHPDLELSVIAAGMHLVGEDPTVREIEAHFPIHASVPMQRSGEHGRAADARALARGIDACVDAIDGHDCVVVLGDRIEAFALASGASIMGIPVAHMHGGDVAEGVADEAMRHAITKLAHLHLPATQTSAERIERMGEPAWRIVRVGSPAADVVRCSAALSDGEFSDLGDPEIVVLHHPCALPEDQEVAFAESIADVTKGRRAVWLAPNADPGRESVQEVRKSSGAMLIDHLPSARFTGLLITLAHRDGVLIGNSSCALIEGAIIGVPAVDIGPRQLGRERYANVHHVASPDAASIKDAIERARRDGASGDLQHGYGDGHTGERVAQELARADFSDPKWLRKRNAY